MFDVLRKGMIGLVASLGLGGAALAEPVFQWPDNPFAPVLADELFTETGEARFDKAARVFVESMGGIGTDLFDIATYPARDPLGFGLYSLGIGALTLVDRETTIFYQDEIVPRVEAFDLYRPNFVPKWMTTDAFWVGAMIAGTYGYGIVANDERAQVAALLSSKAVAYSYLTSHLALKTAFGRRRPVKNLSTHTGPTGVFTTDPYDFFESSGVKFESNADATAMPSFHFTLYFSTARVYSGVYDNYLIPYGIAALLATSSAEGHNHWVSDMVAGALIGTGIGNVILDNYEDRRGPSATFMPIVSTRGAGLGLHMNF